MRAGTIEVAHFVDSQDIPFEELSPAANKGYLRRVGAKCKGKLGAFKDYLAWPYENECQQGLSDSQYLEMRGGVTRPAWRSSQSVVLRLAKAKAVVFAAGAKADGHNNVEITNTKWGGRSDSHSHLCRVPRPLRGHRLGIRCGRRAQSSIDL